MKFLYPAVFRKTESGKFKAHFPDLECCYAEGDTLDEAIDNANEAAYNWLSLELSEEDCELPSVSDEGDMDLQEGDIVRTSASMCGFMKDGMNKHPYSFTIFSHPSCDTR